MHALTEVLPQVELLGTTWRNRATEEVAVVWSVSGGIRLIDIDWQPYGDAISDVRPRINNEPKYWLAQTEEALFLTWQQVRAGWVPLGP